MPSVIAVLWIVFFSTDAPAAPWKLQTPTGLTYELVPPGSRGDPAFHIERRTRDGLPDGRFGPRGQIRFTMGTDYEPPAGLRIDGAGRVLVVGSSQEAGGFVRPVLLRFLSSGQPDPLWGQNGRSAEAPSGWSSRALDALPLADGRVLVAGTVEISGDERAAVWHLTADGRVDERAGRGNRVALASADASRVVSLTSVQDGEVILAVRVLTDADMQLEGHSLNPADADATPQLVSRQPWPPAWSDAPGWLATGGASRWADLARPNEAVAVVRAGPRAQTVAWEPLARNAPGAALPTTIAPMAAAPGPIESKATGGEPGGAAFNPYAMQGARGADAGAAISTAEDEYTGSITLVNVVVTLVVAGVAFAYAFVRRRKRVDVQG